MGNQSAVEMKKCGRCKEWLPPEQFKIEPGTQRPYSYCSDCQSRDVHLRACVSLDKSVTGYEKLTLVDTIPNPVVLSDETFPKVVQALHYWVKNQTLTWKQAEAILLHAVDGFTFADIARMYDITRSNAKYFYDAGIRNLRRRYGIEVHADAV